MTQREYFQVPVAEVIQETDDACSLVLDVPSSLSATFGYRPGQFVTVRVPSELVRLGGAVLLAVEFAAGRRAAGHHRQADGRRVRIELDS